MADTSTSLFGVADSERQKLLAAVSESLALYRGQGSRYSAIETVLSQHDRFGNAPVQINSELVGLTFFTRPRLNLSTISLRQDPHLAMLDILDPMSMMFALRCNLDAVFSRHLKYAELVSKSPWFNRESPFSVPLGNMLVGMTGWPDFSVETESTEPGYFAEDMTLVRGSDRLRRTYDLSCTFRDIQGGFIMAYLYYWLHAMALQMEGTIVAYPDDREANRLNYTCSIYRFVMDPSMRTVLKWAKATGCYPVSVPIGDVFNFGPGDSFIHTSQQFTVPFRANHIAYMDPRDLAAFNQLMRLYAGDHFTRSRLQMNATASNNFMGLPYIDQFSGTNELQWWSRPSDHVAATNNTIDQLLASVEGRATKAMLGHYTGQVTETANA